MPRTHTRGSLLAHFLMEPSCVSHLRYEVLAAYLYVGLLAAGPEQRLLVDAAWAAPVRNALAHPCGRVLRYERIRPKVLLSGTVAPVSSDRRRADEPTGATVGAPNGAPSCSMPPSGAIREIGPGVTMEQLAKAGGVTKPILYRHFGDRDGLIQAIAERFSNDLLTSSPRRWRPTPTPVTCCTRRSTPTWGSSSATRTSTGS